MSVPRSARLAAWTTALLGPSGVAVDNLLDAVTGDDAPHRVDGVLGEGTLLDLIAAWRRSGGAVRVALPVAGDVRGLAGPDDFRGSALAAGEAVIGAGVAAAPEITEFVPSSAPTTVLWHVVAIGAASPDFIAVADAQFELATAIRECASALAAADVAGGETPDLRAARRAGEHLPLPPGFPPRAVTLLAQAERMQAVLDLALADPVGGAVDRAGIAARTSALRPLVTAVRRARVAGYNALADLGAG